MKTPSYDVADFGMTKYGEKARKFILNGAGGAVLEVTDYGGKVVKLFVPDRDGKLVDVSIGFDDPSGWENYDPYWGSIVGRYCNRIAKGVFTLNGKTYSVPRNNVSGGVECALHGGTRGWDAYVWAAAPFATEEDVGIVFTRTSPDGENGFPGKVEVKATYTLTKDNVWRVEFEAVPDQDTPICMTQHWLFNLNGEASGSVDDHLLKLAASATTPVTPDKIPTGEVRPVAGTPFDFLSLRRIGSGINAKDEQLEIGEGYDHNFVLDKGEGFGYAGELRSPLNGVKLEVWTTEPCIHCCTSNWARYDEIAKNGEHLSFRCGISLETQHVPDSPNQPKWPTTIVKAGATYRAVNEYRFGVVS